MSTGHKYKFVMARYRTVKQVEFYEIEGANWKEALHEDREPKLIDTVIVENTISVSGPVQDSTKATAEWMHDVVTKHGNFKWNP